MTNEENDAQGIRSDITDMVFSPTGELNEDGTPKLVYIYDALLRERARDMRKALIAKGLIKPAILPDYFL